MFQRECSKQRVLFGKKPIALIGCVAVFFAVPVFAQEGSRFTFDIGAGFTESVSTAGSALDVGWNVGGGIGYNFSRYFGTQVDVGYTQLGINGATLSNTGFPGGNVNIFSATLDPVVHLDTIGHVDVYAIGGAGEYRVEQDFTQPTVATLGGFNPFFGFYNTSFVTNEVVSSYTVNKLGWNAGLGIAAGTRWHGKIFAEARFNRIYLGGDRRADFVPVTFGFRW